MKRLKIAIQKSGRLQQGSLALLRECGIGIDNGKDQLRASSPNFPVDVLFLRNSDIPGYVRDGVADVGIVGENVLVEKQVALIKNIALGFSKCRLSIAVPKERNYNSVEDLQGLKIATSYPNTLALYLQEKKIAAEIHVISGSVEIAPNIGLADAICDLVSSGSTLFKNNLKEVEKVSSSQAWMVSSPTLAKEESDILEQLRFRMESVLEARRNKYLLMNAPNSAIDDIIKILPGMRSPTVMPLAQTGWSSIHTVIQKDGFWSIIDQLKRLGAEGILVNPIEKMIL